MIPEMNFNPATQSEKFFDLCRTQGNIVLSSVDEKSASLGSKSLKCGAYDRDESVLYQMYILFQKDDVKGSASVSFGMEKIAVDRQTGEESEPAYSDFARSWEVGFNKDGTPSAQKSYGFFEEGSYKRLFEHLACTSWPLYKILIAFNLSAEMGERAVLKDRFDLYERLIRAHDSKRVKREAGVDAAGDMIRASDMKGEEKKDYIAKVISLAFPDDPHVLPQFLSALEMSERPRRPESLS